MQELEFLPQEYTMARFRRQIGFIRSWLLLALGLAMVLWSMQLGTWVRDARAELQALRGTGFAVQADVDKVRRLSAEAHGYNRRLALLEKITPRTSVSQVIADVAALLPEGTVLEALCLADAYETGGSRPRLRIVGFAPTEQAVADMVSALGAAQFDRVVLSESRTAGGPDAARRSFIIEAEVKATPTPPTPAREE